MKKSLLYLMALVEFSYASVVSEIPGNQWPMRLAGIFLGIGFILLTENPFKVIASLEDLADELSLKIEESQNKFASLTDRQKLELQKGYEELEEHRKLVESELANQQQLMQVDLSDREAKLAEAAQQQAEIIQRKIDEANEQLESDKQDFLEAHQRQIEQLDSRIEQLECDLAAAYETLQSYDLPQMPEGVSQHELASRRVIEILQRKGCVADYRGSWREDGFILVRVRPRDGSEAEIRKHLKLIELELELAEPVRLATKEGAIQIWLRPQEMVVSRPTIAPSETSAKLTVLTAQETSEFVEPTRKLSPYGEIKSIELEWVDWLYHQHRPKPVRNQIEIIRRIWGASNGSKDYSIARDRLRKIFEQLGIKSRQRA